MGPKLFARPPKRRLLMAKKSCRLRRSQVPVRTLPLRHQTLHPWHRFVCPKHQMLIPPSQMVASTRCSLSGECLYHHTRRREGRGQP
jgi:hypothetical protein